MALRIGQTAPDFTLPATAGKSVSLSKNLAGQACIIYFYPKDFTGGCTKEACTFRDYASEFAGLNVPVFGISRDSIESHQKFIAAHRLPFELLSDESGKVCEAYDALIPIVRVPKRITYLLDREHKIKAVFDSLFDADSHIHQMIAALRA